MISIIGNEHFHDNLTTLQHTDPKDHRRRVDLGDLEDWGLLFFDDRSDETVFDHLFDSEETPFSKLAHKGPQTR